MGYKRIPQNLTAIQVRILFKIDEVTKADNFPPRITKLCDLERTYNYETIFRHLYILKDWGYVDIVANQHKYKFWLLTPKGKDLINGGEVKVMGEGELR